ncbi:hypothetical protein ACLB1S_26895 [Escherichia coli]
MDIKIEGITKEDRAGCADQAEVSVCILGVMEQAINAPRRRICSEFAPRIHTIKINPDKIKDVIGKGGSVIRALTN